MTSTFKSVTGMMARLSHEPAGPRRRLYGSGTVDFRIVQLFEMEVAFGYFFFMVHLQLHDLDHVSLSALALSFT